jgi:hypothetical protein
VCALLETFIRALKFTKGGGVTAFVRVVLRGEAPILAPDLQHSDRRFQVQDGEVIGLCTTTQIGSPELIEQSFYVVGGDIEVLEVQIIGRQRVMLCRGRGV